VDKLEGCDNRALILDGDHLEILRWGNVEHRVPVTELDYAKVVRDDKGKTLGVFGKAEERARISFGGLTACIWVPLQDQGSAEAFGSRVDAAISASGADARPAERDDAL
jgi:hypothetical protein